MQSNPALNHYRDNLPAGYTSQNAVTIDSVVQKTFVTLGLVVLSSLATWLYFGSLVAQEDVAGIQSLYTVATVASFATLGLSFWISMSSKTRVGVILLFAALEGVVLGVFTKIAELQAGLGAPVGALAGTLVAFAVTLSFYKFINGNISARFMRITTMLVFGFVALSLVDFALHFVSLELGLNGLGPMGFAFSLLGFGIAIAMLLTDFRLVEDAIQYRLPEEESWRLAFGLTVTLVWLYVNILRMILSFRSLADN